MNKRTDSPQITAGTFYQVVGAPSGRIHSRSRQACPPAAASRTLASSISTPNPTPVGSCGMGKKCSNITKLILPKDEHKEYLEIAFGIDVKCVFVDHIV